MAGAIVGRRGEKGQLIFQVPGGPGFGSGNRHGLEALLRAQIGQQQIIAISE
jgi:hypothetical protein